MASINSMMKEMLQQLDASIFSHYMRLNSNIQVFNQNLKSKRVFNDYYLEFTFFNYYK